VRVGGVGGGVLHELGTHRECQAAAIDELGFEDGVQVEGAFAPALSQAALAVRPTEREETRTVQCNDELAGEAASIECFHADEPSDALGSQPGDCRRADMTDKMIQGFVHRQRLLTAAGRPIDVFEDMRFGIAQLAVELAAAAELAAEQQQAPPHEELLVVLDEGQEAGVGQLLEPGIESGPEVAIVLTNTSPSSTTFPSSGVVRSRVF